MQGIAISGAFGYGAYGYGGVSGGYGSRAPQGGTAGLEGTAGLTGSVGAGGEISGVGEAKGSGGARQVESGECETCKNRRYVDGSNEGNVSFKAPGHISPAESGAKVMSHEREHMANARREGGKENKELVSASISLKMAVCPECGRSYVEGGETRTTMKTTYSSNPYDQARKTVEGSFLAGQNVNVYA